MQGRVFTYLSDTLTTSQLFGANKDVIDYYDGFLFAANHTELKNFWFTPISTGNYYGYNGVQQFGFYRVALTQGQEIQNMNYKLVSFIDFLGRYVALTISILSAVAYFIGSYQSFIVDKSMMKQLYGEVPDQPPDTVRS